MPTNIATKSRSDSPSSTSSLFAEASRSDDLTVLLLWTATGLAVSLGFTWLGLQPDMAESLLMIG
jgi:hypothetical protein